MAEFDGKYNYFSGNYAGSGTIEYGPNSFSKLFNLTVEGYQYNKGVVDDISGMTLSNTSTIVNEGEWDLPGDVSLLAVAGEFGADFMNGDILAKTAGTGVSYVTVYVGTDINRSFAGGLAVASGTLDMEGGAIFGGASGDGTLEIGGGDAKLSGRLASVDVRNWTLAGGTMEIATGASVIYAGTFTGEKGATLDLDNDISDTPFSLTGSTDLSGLDITGSGVLDLAGITTVSSATLEAGGVFDSNWVTQSGGNVTIGSGRYPDSGLEIQGGVWDIKDSSDILNAAGVISISSFKAGLLEKTGAGVSVVQPDVFNQGMDVQTGSTSEFRGIEVTAGTLDLKGGVLGVTVNNLVEKPGSDNIVGAGTLEFDSVVEAKQTVLFSGSHGTLDLTDLADFGAAIVGFDTVGNHDTLLIGGGYAFAGASVSATAATLSFSLGSATDTLTLTGDYRGGSFSAQTLTGGVLKVTF